MVSCCLFANWFICGLRSLYCASMYVSILDMALDRHLAMRTNEDGGEHEIDDVLQRVRLVLPFSTDLLFGFSPYMCDTATGLPCRCSL